MVKSIALSTLPTLAVFGSGMVARSLAREFDRRLISACYDCSDPVFALMVLFSSIGALIVALVAIVAMRKYSSDRPSRWRRLGHAMVALYSGALCFDALEFLLLSSWHDGSLQGSAMIYGPSIILVVSLLVLVMAQRKRAD